MQSKNKALIIVTLLFILFLFSIFFIDFDLGKVKIYVESFGIFAPFVFIFLMTIAIVISPIPSIPLDIIGGIIFGWFIGGLYAIAGASLGAMISFIISRKYGRILLEKYLKTNLDILYNVDEKYLVLFVFLSRLLPLFQFDIISYASGLTKMNPVKFALATIFGMAPITFFIAYYGETIIFGNAIISIILTVVVIVFMVITHKLILNKRKIRL